MRAERTCSGRVRAVQAGMTIDYKAWRTVHKELDLVIGGHVVEGELRTREQEGMVGCETQVKASAVAVHVCKLAVLSSAVHVKPAPCRSRPLLARRPHRLVPGARLARVLDVVRLNLGVSQLHHAAGCRGGSGHGEKGPG